MSDLQPGTSIQNRATFTIASLVTTCANCGHVFKVGESTSVCPECGAHEIKVAEDAGKTIQVRCVA